MATIDRVMSEPGSTPASPERCRIATTPEGMFNLVCREGRSRIRLTPIQCPAPYPTRLSFHKMTVCLHSASTLSLHFLHHSLSLPSTPTMSSYELAFQLHGHASDVRTLCAPSPDIPLLISGSRDGSALLWGPGRGKEWDVKLRVEAPEKKYVSCVGMTRWQGEGESLSQ